MKKILILLIGVLVFAGCSKVDTVNPETQADQSMANIAHLYGTMLPDKSTPQTRGVADGDKIWSKTQAVNSLTVKFLNGPTSYINFVKEVAKEWEKVAKVKFNFVESDQTALIRIAFDYADDMNASWAMTGRDHTQVRGNQSEPTVHYGNWASLSEARKYNDVLRTFGQVLGLELEFRHPDFDPGWIKDAKGNIDEAKVKTYWEMQLANVIPWNDLKAIVLDPLSDQAFDIVKTEKYDPNSIMTWSLPKYIANNIPVNDYNDPIITKISEQDKAFIQELYGKPTDTPNDDFFVPLIEFEYTGTAPQFTVMTNKNLAVKWDAAISSDYISYKIPTSATTPQTLTISNNFPNCKN